MDTGTWSTILQLVVGLGLLNVWLLRAGQATGYRGGSAETLREEFATYGLPPLAFQVVGLLKVLAGILLLVGIWVHAVVAPAAAVVAVLMVGAVAMHLKVGDPPRKSLPALAMLVMSTAIVYLN